MSTAALNAGGVKAIGMGAIGVAYTQEATNGFQNPAGMVNLGNRFDIDVGFQYMHGSIKIKGNSGPHVNGKFNSNKGCHYWPAAEIGINKQLNDCASIGLVLGAKTQLIKTSYKKPVPLYGITDFGEEQVLSYISPMASFKVGSCQSFGFGFNLGIQRLLAKGFQNFDNPAISAFPGHVTNRGYDYDWGYGFTFGWQADLTNYLSIGVRFDTRTRMQKGWSKYKGFIPIKGKTDNPATLAYGLKIKLPYNVNFAFDVEKVFTSRVPAYYNDLYPNVFDSRLGLADGPGHGYKDLLVYHFGIDYNWDCYILRAGWIYGKAGLRPPNTATSVSTLNNVENWLSIGGTWKYNSSLEFSFAYQHGFTKTIKGHNSISPAFGGGEINVTYGTDLILAGCGFCF